ncbi:hypothetical protein PsW64_04786 [Pseudovibrio sp. W64]|nr:hypothetical protein PsW64_04786 [Pseudovibrio sp. W64]
MAPRAKALEVGWVEIRTTVFTLNDVIGDQLMLQLREVLAAHLADTAALLLDVPGERLPFRCEIKRINRLWCFAQRWAQCVQAGSDRLEGQSQKPKQKKGPPLSEPVNCTLHVLQKSIETLRANSASQRLTLTGSRVQVALFGIAAPNRSGPGDPRDHPDMHDG